MDSTSASKAKKPRASKPKSRTGCSTCKIRRVKCDEARPICSRCQKTLRNCGYQGREPPVSQGSTAFVPIQPRENSKKFGHDTQYDAVAIRLPEEGAVTFQLQDSLLFANLSTPFLADENEQRYFQLFRDETIFDLCGYFETPFWTTLVLRECHSEPAIMHAVLALGALYKASLSQSGTNDEHHKLALVQQGKALKCLKERLSGSSFPIRLALIISLVFGYLESLHGNWKTAMEQVHSGVKLLKTWQEANHGSTSKAVMSIQHPANIDPELFSVLPRLDLQMLSFLAMNPVSDKHFSEVDGVEEIGCIPDHFESVQEALPYATRMSLLALVHLRKCNKLKLASPVSFPSFMVYERDTLNKAFKQWDKAFQRAWQQQHFNVANNTILGAIMFDIYVRVFFTIADTSMSLHETVYDDLFERFEYIVKLSGYMLRKEQFMRATYTTRLQFNIGLIMSLFFTATRCREGSVRRHAIALLQDYPSRNGIWDSWQAAQVAKWVVKLEEEGCDEYGFVPEEWRVRMHTLKWTSEVDQISVECMQGPIDGVLKLRKVNL